jgi:hypothetical protein
MTFVYARMALTAIPLFFIHARVDAQINPSVALLRCDPWTVIKAIDGRVRKVSALQGGAFTDCEIPLSAGRHVVKVCYEGRGLTMLGMQNVITLYRCDQDRLVEFEAAEAHVYRLRLSLETGFAPTIEDVTVTERNVPASPTENKSRRGLPKEQRDSMILLRASGGGEPAFLAGKVQHLWFKVSRMAQAFSGPDKMRAETDGYFTGTVGNGDTVSLRHMESEELPAFVCDTEVPVYEDLPGGRVLYLGDYHFESGPTGRQFTVTWDLESARKFLLAQHPTLVDKLELADSRELRVPEPCLLFSAQQRLRRAPSAN